MRGFGVTDVGQRRTVNQDSFIIKQTADDRLLAVVCDGMGGAAGGLEASSTAAGTFAAFAEAELEKLGDGAPLKAQKAERYTVKQMERTRKSLEARLAKLNDQSRKDDVVTFEQLGVDRLFIDESHYFKNLFLATKMRNVGGIAQTEAQKSSDLFMKTQYLDELTGGRGVIFATGTPISNSMVELYTIQRYLQYRLLQEMGLIHFDDWASNFGETVTAIELSPEGYTLVGR